MVKAFLSHSSSQTSLIEKVYSALGRNNCVYYVETFEAGQRINDEIIDSINSCQLFVAFISDASLDSRWVKSELRHARELLDDDKIKVLPIIIDQTIDHNDKRIPAWLRSGYTLKYIDNFPVILNKIKKELTRITLEDNPIAKKKHELFIGRNTLMSSFEDRFYSAGIEKPSAYIISGFNGIGRRTFAKNALIKTGLFKRTDEPISIFLNDKESIENAIIQLSGSNVGVELSTLDVLTKSKEEKVKYFQEQVANLVKVGELLMIVDNGSIVLPNGRLVDWFIEFLNHPVFKNTVSVYVVSRFRTNALMDLRVKAVDAFHVEPLIRYEIGALMVRYGALLGLQLESEDVQFFSERMNGMPEQIQFACGLIQQRGIDTAKKNIAQVIEHGKDRVQHVIDEYKNNATAINMLSLLADMEFISMDYLYKVVGQTDEIDILLSDFYAKGVYELIGVNKGYVRMSYAISDYIRQSKFKISETHRNRIRTELKHFLSGDANSQAIDGSDTLYNIREAIIGGHKIPTQYYIPAFVLKTVVELYNRARYSDVIALADKALEYESISDRGVVRELRNWLCMALARTKNERFSSEVKYFTGNTYHFLRGFNYRIRKEINDAEYEYKRVDRSSPTYRRVQKELVNMYLDQRLYDKALVYAREIYETERGNPFYIQSYFQSLIRRDVLSGNDILIIKDLIIAMKNNHSAKAANMSIIMDAEYKCYVDNDYSRAIQIISPVVNPDDTNNPYFALKALREIHRKHGNFSEVTKVQAELDTGDEE